VGGFELSDPEKPPLEHGLTATEGDRRAIFIADWAGVQVTLWQLNREKSLIAKRSKMKGNSGHTSKANFGSDICEFESSHPSQISVSAKSPLLSVTESFAAALVSAKRSNGWRNLASTSPSLQVQFDSKKFSNRFGLRFASLSHRISVGSLDAFLVQVSNRICASAATKRLSSQ
jgi:hypothetical protein